MNTASIHRRVVVAALVLLAVALAIVATVVALTLRQDLRSTLRSRLSSDAVLARRLAGALPAQDLADRLTNDQITARITTAGSTVVGSAKPARRATAPVPARPPVPPTSATPPSPGSTPAPPAAGPSVVNLGGGALQLTEVLPGVGSLSLSASERPITATLQRLVAIEVLVSLAALAVAALVLGRIVRLALAPLGRVSAVAAAIAGGEPGRRLRPDRTDTELGAMASAFDTMVDSLEEAVARATTSEATMRQFLGDASHELRTPVAAVQATLETLLRDDPPRAEREELELVALREVSRLTRLVTDLLALARDEDPHEGPLAVVDLAQVVHAESARFRQRSPGTPLRIHMTSDIKASGSTDAVGRALANLLDNAAAAAPGRTIDVVVHATETAATIVVDDEGPGVAVADRHRIFDRFVRLDTARSGGGSGLGLAIARSSVRRHGGEVACLDRPDGQPGSRFAISLPSPPA